MAVALAFKAFGLVTAAQSLGFQVDVVEVAQWALRATRMANTLHHNARGLNERALNEMVELAQSRAPERTGALRLGITGTREGELLVFKAEAHGARGGKEGADYAPFVERGTRAGTRGRVYERPAPGEFGRRRAKARRTHPGTEAQPFFYVSAREVLERYRQEQTAAYARASAQTVEAS